MVSEIPLVEEYMRNEVYFLNGEDTLSKAIGIFRETNIPIVVVLSGSGEYAGVVTERVVLRSTLNLDTTKIKTVSVKVPPVSKADTVARAARLMLENTVKGLPVTEDNEKIVGTITVDDVGRAAGERMYPKMRVRDVMSKDPVTVTPDSTIGKALVLMRENGISRLPVVERDKLVGLVTIRDIIDKVIHVRSRVTRGEVAGEKLRSLGNKVSEIMTRHVIQSTPEEELTRAIRKMIDNDVSCVVVTQSNRVVGIMTWTDVLEVVASLEEAERPAINVQVSFKLRDISQLEKSEVMKVAERYISKFGDVLGSGSLLLHFKEHKEKHGEEHLIHCRARIRTDKVDLVGVGEAWSVSQAARAALDRIERQLLVMKELSGKYPYIDEVLREMVGEI